MYRVMYKSDAQYVSCRAGIYYYTRRVPIDVRQYYASPRLSFSLRTKSYAGAVRAAQSVTQRLEDYWLGLRLQDMDIPAIHLVRTDGVANDAPVMLDAVENYLKLKGNDDRIFIRTARRNGGYVAKLLGNRPITSYSTAEAAQFRDWCFDKGIVLEEDAYDIGIEKEHRDIVKQSFNAMVQAETKLTSPPNDVDWKSTGRTWKELRQLILDKHEPIKDSFFCGMGNRLQFRDSQLAEQIMLRFAKQDIPVLPVHDSFIIIRGLYSELVNAMHDEFEKMFGVPINIDDSAKASQVSFAPEDVDVDWIISETDEYGSWTDRNPL